MNIDELKAQLEDVRQQMRSKNRNNPVEAAEYVELKAREDALIEQITAAQKEQAQEQKHEELQELVRGYNLNEIFDHPDANKIVHTMLMEEAQKYISQLAEKDVKIAALTAQGQETEDQLRAATEKLEQMAIEATNLQEANAQLQQKLNDATAEIEKHTADNETIDELRKELRYNRNEVARLTLENQNLQKRVDAAAMEKQQFETNTPLDELVKNAKAHTNKKRQLANVRKNADGSITGTDAEGREVTVPWFAEKSIEAVDTFPAAPETSMGEVQADNPVTVGVDPVEVPTFPVPEAIGVPSVQSAADGSDNIGGGADDDALSLESLAERVKALEAKVFAQGAA
ncbi:hypothetical protein MO973_19605 [Paenibacillus sp. TRM 82003]|nr:hypothetical protein [Paenibacillus sp. TRM 82003]